MSEECYTLEELAFESPVLQCARVSYLITMVDSTRRESYMAQLQTFRPTARVVIVHNRGFRRCHKEGVQTVAQDIWHANCHVARLAAAEPFALILEDDVVFTEEFRRMAPHIDDLLLRSHGPVAYNLGALSFASRPVDSHHLRTYAGGFAHAIIYSGAALRCFEEIDLPPKPWGLHDLYVTYRFRVYAPRTACAVQPYERTSNAEAWDRARVFDGLYTLCRRQPTRLFAAYDGINRAGGVLAVATTLAAGLAYAAVR